MAVREAASRGSSEFVVFRSREVFNKKRGERESTTVYMGLNFEMSFEISVLGEVGSEACGSLPFPRGIGMEVGTKVIAGSKIRTKFGD